MKKLWFLLGIGVGYVLGSKAGSGPYRQLETKVRSVASRPEVKETVAKVKSAAEDRAAEVGQKAEGVTHRVAEGVSGAADSIR